MIRDMTVGKPIKLIFSFFFPVLVGELLQQVYIMVDMAIVGRFVGVQAFAGIVATGALNSLIIGFLLGLCHGFAIPVAQSFGANNLSGMREYFANAIYLSALISISMAFVTVALTRNILCMINIPNDIFEPSVAYITIIFGGMPFAMLYNLASSVLRSVGDTRSPLFFLVISSVANLLFDLLFVVVWQLGAAGAALATVIAQLLSGVMCLLWIFRKYKILRIHVHEWQLNSTYVRRLLAMGLPMGLESSLTAVGSIIIQRAVNGLGMTAVAAIGASDKVMFVFSAPFGAIGATLATYSGQNFGAKRIDRIRKGVRVSLIVMLAYCAAVYGLQRLAGIWMVALLIDPSEVDILSAAVKYLDIACLFFPGFLCIMIFRNALQGVGYSRVAMLSGVFETATRLLVALLLIPSFGFAGAYTTHPMAWVLATAFLIPAYLLIIRRTERTMLA